MDQMIQLWEYQQKDMALEQFKAELKIHLPGKGW